MLADGLRQVVEALDLDRSTLWFKAGALTVGAGTA